MKRWVIWIVLCGVVIPACGKAPRATPATPEALGPPAAGAASTPSLEAAPTAQQDNCVDDAAFISDLSLPDGTAAAPGDKLSKQWSVQNTGTCDWGPDYRLVPILPNPLSDSGPVALYPARAGTQAIWQVSIDVPNSEGEVIGRWQAQNPDGVAFGEQVYVVLEVTSPTAVPSAASPTP